MSIVLEAAKENRSHRNVRTRRTVKEVLQEALQSARMIDGECSQRLSCGVLYLWESTIPAQVQELGLFDLTSSRVRSLQNVLEDGQIVFSVARYYRHAQRAGAALSEMRAHFTWALSRRELRPIRQGHQQATPIWTAQGPQMPAPVHRVVNHPGQWVFLEPEAVADWMSEQ